MNPKDLFADLQRERKVSEKTARILQYAPAMLEAHEQRGATWKQLAARLGQVGIKVAPEYLRALMERHAATIKAAASKDAPTVVVVNRKQPETKPAQKSPSLPPKPDAQPAGTRNSEFLDIEGEL